MVYSEMIQKGSSRFKKNNSKKTAPQPCYTRVLPERGAVMINPAGYYALFENYLLILLRKVRFHVSFFFLFCVRFLSKNNIK